MLDIMAWVMAAPFLSWGTRNGSSFLRASQSRPNAGVDLGLWPGSAAQCSGRLAADAALLGQRSNIASNRTRRRPTRSGLTARNERCDRVHEISLSCSSRRWWQKSKSGLSDSTWMHYHPARTSTSIAPGSFQGQGRLVSLFSPIHVHTKRRNYSDFTLSGNTCLGVGPLGCGLRELLTFFASPPHSCLTKRSLRSDRPSGYRLRHRYSVHMYIHIHRLSKRGPPS